MFAHGSDGNLSTCRWILSSASVMPGALMDLDVQTSANAAIAELCIQLSPCPLYHVS